MHNIYFIGGSPCSGKSTIAERIVQKYGFQYYKQDNYLKQYIEKGIEQAIDLFKKVSKMTTEEMWMRDPSVQYQEEISIYETMISYSLDDLKKFPKDKPIIAEGAGFFPHLAACISILPSHYICIAPTKEFQIQKYSQREWIQNYLLGCTDKEKAFSNWMERDALLAKKQLDDAVRFGYPYILVDGKDGIHDNFLLVEKAFHLIY